MCAECNSDAARVTSPGKLKPPMVQDLQERAKQLVVDYFNQRAEKTDGVWLGLEDVYVVWFSKTLQNWKALVSTAVPDGMYYEVTYNGGGRVTYLDAYKKFENVSIPD
jgi:hypothetical protein